MFRDYCKKSNFNNNVTGFIQKRSPKTRSKLVSNQLKTAVQETGGSLRGGTIDLQSGSNTLKVSVGTPKQPPKEPKFTHENLIRMQTAHNLSDKTIK